MNGVESNVGREKIGRSPPHARLAGTLWFAGWLFTIGFAKLVWWKIARWSSGLIFLSLAMRG
jgi:hypothetical protein